jgi:hypothetical protein
MLFDSYLFADYSGAVDRSAQRRAIRVAEASGTGAPTIVSKRFTRDDLVTELVNRLRDATRRGTRVCFGQDHQYGIPVALGRELALDHLPWREALRKLCDGSYGSSAPPLAHPKVFARAFNEWLSTQGRQAYFYSATKASLYGLPSRNPRDGDRSTYRLTEQCRPTTGTGAPKPFNRVGDNGTVGGQSLVGMIALRQLMATCEKEKLHVAVWPFDGLSITEPAYTNAHVLLEPYPTAVRQRHIVQTDEADALASVARVQDADAGGNLCQLLDLSSLKPPDVPIVRFEGWILSHHPGARRTTRSHGAG